MKRSITFLFAVLFAFAGVSFAQSGGFKGKVKAPNGNGIANASISILQDGKEVKSATTNGKGEFKISGLSAGKYNVSFDANGYSEGTLHGVEVKNGIRDLGDRLILSLDRGTFVFVQGSVFFKEGSSVTGAKIELEQVNADGSTKSISSSYSNSSGEFSFRRPPGITKYRITAKLKGISASKDVDIEEAAIYRVALTLNMSRNDR
ncbi:MAG: carboxypeptidase-like regulatory domain-containing protein [Pyrinomonadaceae bacterium]